MGHVIPRMGPPILQGTWESRDTSGEAPRRVDSGCLETPIILHLQAHHGALQECIDGWHQQVPIHALSQASPLVFLQLARYSFGDGVAVKNSQAIQIPHTGHIPVFGREQRCFKAKYQIVAAVIHHGNNTLSGHYTAVLWNPSDRGHCWETNDNRVMRARASPPSAMLRNSYLIALIRSL